MENVKKNKPKNYNIVNMEVTLQLKQLNEIEMVLNKNNETKIKIAELSIWNCMTVFFCCCFFLLAIKSFQCELNNVGILVSLAICTNAMAENRLLYVGKINISVKCYVYTRDVIENHDSYCDLFTLSLESREYALELHALKNFYEPIIKWCNSF